MKFRFLAVPVAAVLLVAGCTPIDGPPTPSPSSVVSAPTTPIPSASSSEDALYAEAERVYRASVEAQWKYELTGDYSEFPPELAEYYTVEQLSIVKDSFEYGKENGLRVTGGEPSVTASQLLGGSADADISVRGCYDARGLIVVDGQGAELGKGQLIREDVHLRFDGEKLKIFEVEVAEVVECSE